MVDPGLVMATGVDLMDGHGVQLANSRIPLVLAMTLIMLDRANLRISMPRNRRKKLHIVIR